MRPVAKDDLCNDAVTLKQEAVIALSHILLKLSAPFLFKGSQVLQLSSGKGEQLVWGYLLRSQFLKGTPETGVYLRPPYSDWCKDTSCKSFFLPILSECRLCLIFGSGSAG